MASLTESSKPTVSTSSSRFAILTSLALSVFWLLAVYTQMTTRPTGSADDSLVFNERLVFVARFCDSLPIPIRSTLLRFAHLLEADPARLAIIEQRTVSQGSFQSLTPGYKALAEFQRHPSEALKLGLQERAFRGLARLNGSFALFGVLLLVILAMTLMGSRPPPTESPSPTSSLSVYLVLGGYWLWHALSVFGVRAALWDGGGNLSLFQRICLSFFLTYSLMTVLFMVAWVKMKWRPLLERSVGWVGAGYVLVWLAYLLGESLTGWLPPVQDFRSVFFQLMTSNGHILVLTMLVVLVGPFFEEAMFRGWILGGLKPHLGSVGSLAVSAFLFALGHGDAGQLPTYFFVGLVFGWIYLTSRSLWTCFAVHVLWNATSLLHLYAGAPKG